MAAPRYMIPKCSCLLQHGTNTQAPPAHVLPIIGAAYEVVGAAYEVIGAETEACTGAVTEPVATWAALTPCFFATDSTAGSERVGGGQCGVQLAWERAEPSWSTTARQRWRRRWTSRE